MTSRGNPSISPPAQISVQSQPRQVSAFPSGTPPPQQQFFTGQTQLPQGVFEYHPSQQGQQPGQSLLPHQAYGSAPNDTRVISGNGRVVPPQQGIPQGGYYQQPGQTMRPQAPQPAQQATYYVSGPQQRPQRPQFVMFQAQPGFAPNSGIMLAAPTQSYPRVPLYVPQPQGPQYRAQNSYQMVNFANGQIMQSGQIMPQGATRQGPQHRERKLIEIKDPNTGRSITEELCNKPQLTDIAGETIEEPQVSYYAPQSNNPVAQELISRVAEMMKTSGVSGIGAAPVEPPQTSVENNGMSVQYPQQMPQQQPTQQMPQQQPSQPMPQQQQSQSMPPPQQAQQPPQVAPNMMRSVQHPSHMIPGQTGMHSHIMPAHNQPMMAQPPSSGTPPEMMGSVRPQMPEVLKVNLAVPPPAIPQQVRQPTPAQIFVPQQSHAGPQTTQPQTAPQQQHPHAQQQQVLQPHNASQQQHHVMAPHIQQHVPQQPQQNLRHMPQGQAPVLRPQVIPPAMATSPPSQQPVTLSAQAVHVAPSQPIHYPVEPSQNKPVSESTCPSSGPMQNVLSKPDEKEISPVVEKPMTEVKAPVEHIPAVQAVDERQSSVQESEKTICSESPLQTSKGHEETPPIEKISQPESEEIKEIISLGASNQGKDGRKGKKKTFKNKDSIGSDMDAFIDGKENDIKEALQKPKIDVTEPVSEDSQTDKSASPTTVNSASSSTVPVQKEDTPPPVSTFKEVSPENGSKDIPTQNKVLSTETAEVENQSQPQKADEIPSPASTEVEKSPSPAEKSPTPVKLSTPEPEKQEIKPSIEKVNDVSVEKSIDEDAPKDVNDENEPPNDDGDQERSPSPPVEEGINIQKFMKDGKLTYDRSYLMELRECIKSQTKPVGLPNLDIILDRPVMNANKGGMAGPMDFTPSFFQPGVGGQRHAPSIGKTSSGRRPGPNDGRMPPKIIPARMSINNDVKPLHKSENAWKPKDNEKEKTLESEVLFIMNRLTPTNFNKLAEEMKKCQVKDYDDLQHLVKIFFDKVTIETKFVSAYAQLCKVMAGLKVPPPPGLKESQATFRVVMLTKCQQEFEADKAVIFENPEEKRKALEAEMPADTPKREEKIEEVLYRMKLKRLNFYGNIRFIGELFKLGMLTENIMHDCIYRLLKARDDDSLVSLCNLLTTVGQNLDTDKAKTRMDQYFAQMTKIAEERKSRIKFTLKDAIELRKNHWVPRKETTGPKKIDEVHKDYAKEQERAEIMKNAPPPPRNDPPPGSRKGSRQQRPEDKQAPNDDGWNTVGGNTKSIRIDASKMRLSKQSVVDENSIQLGPGGGMKFGMWGRGSFGGAQQQSQDERSPVSNRFSALRDDGKGRQFERSPSRGDNGPAGRNMRQGPIAGHGRGKMMARSSQEGDRRDLLASARQLVRDGGRSQNSSRDNSWNRDDRRSMGPRGSGSRDNPMTRSDITPVRPTEEFRAPAAPAPKKVKAMSEEEMEHKSKTILEEYLNVRDLAEGKLCVTELAGQPLLHLFVTASVNDVIEKNERARVGTGEFLHELLKDNCITTDMYMKGMKEVLDFAEDMVIDIPQIWMYLAQIITPMLVGGSLNLSQCISMLKQSLQKSCTVKLLAPCFTQLKDKLGEEAVAHMWKSSGSSWSEFMPESDVENFLKDKGIEFVCKPIAASTAAKLPVPGQPDWNKFADDVEALVRNGKPNSDVIAFVEKTAGTLTSHHSFIRALMTGIANSSISRPPNAMKTNEDVIKARKDILQKYIKSIPELELQALYAIQSLMTKIEHPSGVMSSLFDYLYDTDVVSEESCKQWEKSTDPAEQEGKGVCLKQLTQFFTWLNESEEPEPAS